MSHLVTLIAMIVTAMRAREEVSAGGFDEGVERVERELGARFPGWRRGSWSRSAYGTIGDATVAITVEPSMSDVTGAAIADLIVVLEGPRIPRAISFMQEGGGDQDVLTGDPYFDDTVKLQGDPAAVR